MFSVYTKKYGYISRTLQKYKTLCVADILSWLHSDNERHAFLIL